jgi:hypothetical protein
MSLGLKCLSSTISDYAAIHVLRGQFFNSGFKEEGGRFENDSGRQVGKGGSLGEWGLRFFWGGGILGDVLVLAGDGFGLGVLRDAGVGCGGGV